MSNRSNPNATLPFEGKPYANAPTNRKNDIRTAIFSEARACCASAGTGSGGIIGSTDAIRPMGYASCLDAMAPSRGHVARPF